MKHKLSEEDMYSKGKITYIYTEKRFYAHEKFKLILRNAFIIIVISFDLSIIIPRSST